MLSRFFINFKAEKQFPDFKYQDASQKKLMKVCLSESRLDFYCNPIVGIPKKSRNLKVGPFRPTCSWLTGAGISVPVLV